MNKRIYSIITGSGRYIPTQIVPNRAFIGNTFYDVKGERIAKTNDEIIEKFQQITEIEEINQRLYVLYIIKINTQIILQISEIGQKKIDKEKIDKEFVIEMLNSLRIKYE